MSKTNSLPNARLSPEVRLQRSADFSSRHCTSIGDALVVSGFSMFERGLDPSLKIFIHIRVL